VDLLDRRLAYEGHGVDVEIRRYRRLDGTEVERQVIDHPGPVAIRAHDEESSTWSPSRARRSRRTPCSRSRRAP
jgi:hypothetical protein